MEGKRSSNAASSPASPRGRRCMHAGSNNALAVVELSMLACRGPRSLFGGPLSTRAACEDTSVRAAILAAAEAERLKAAAAAARRAGSAGASSSKAHAHAPPPKPDPKEVKKKIIKNDLDAFDELNTDGPAKKPAGPAGGGAGDKGKAAAGAAAGKPGNNGSRAAAAAAGGKQRAAQTAAGLQQVRMKGVRVQGRHGFALEEGRPCMCAMHGKSCSIQVTSRLQCTDYIAYASLAIPLPMPEPCAHPTWPCMPSVCCAVPPMNQALSPP